MVARRRRRSSARGRSRTSGRRSRRTSDARRTPRPRVSTLTDVRSPIGLPQSHRARVRLLRRSIIAAVLVVVAILLAFFRNTGTSLETPHEKKNAVVLHEPKHV